MILWGTQGRPTWETADLVGQIGVHSAATMVRAAGRSGRMPHSGVDSHWERGCGTGSGLQSF